MDIPLPTAEAGGNLDADVEMPTVTMPHGVHTTGTVPIGGDAPPSNIVVPAGTLVIPLPMPPQPAMPADQIIRINPNPVFPLELSTKILALLVPQHADPFSVEAPVILRGSAKPMADLSLVNQRTKTQFTGKLAALRWTYQLTLHDFNLILGRFSDPIASSINLLVDEATHLSDLPQARAQHTLALMLAARGSLRELYAQLRVRAASGVNLAPHIDWGQLPLHAIVVEYLAGSDANEFPALVANVLLTLPTFSNEVQAQVYADLCSLFTYPEYLQILSEFNTDESNAQLERLKHFEAAAQAYGTKTPIHPMHVAPLFKALPPAGVPWNLSALSALQLLTRLRANMLIMLTPEQERALIDKVAEMLRHFISLARPGAKHHPLIGAAQFLSTHVELKAAFLQLSPQEKVKLLQIYPYDKAFELVDHLVQGGGLPVVERLRLIEDILGQPGVPSYIEAMLRHRMVYLLRQAGPL